MANGFLTGRYHRDSVFENGTDYRSDMPQYTEEGFTKGQELLELLHNLAEKKRGNSGTDFSGMDAV